MILFLSLTSENKWWSSTPEGKQEVKERIDEFMMRLRYADDDAPIIVVGHSHYWRTVLNKVIR